MYWRYKAMKGLSIESCNGAAIGVLRDLFFSRSLFSISHLCIGRLGKNKNKSLIIPTETIAYFSPETRRLRLKLELGDIMNAPLMADGSVITKDYENAVGLYYRANTSLMYKKSPVTTKPKHQGDASCWLDHELSNAMHLRSSIFRGEGRYSLSSEETLGYKIYANGREAGLVSDFFIADELWRIVYLVFAKTRLSLPPEESIIPIFFVPSANWGSRSIELNFSLPTIRESPGLPTAKLESAYEAIIRDYYFEKLKKEMLNA